MWCERDTQKPETTQKPVRAAVSPDVIAYSRLDDGETFVHTIRADGSGDQPLIDYVTAPAWSPDGARIAVGSEGIWL